MANKRMMRGVPSDQEVNAARFYKDTRTGSEKFFANLKTSSGAGHFLIIAAALALVLSPVWELVLIAMVFYWLFMRGHYQILPFALPQTSGLLDAKNPKPGRTDPAPATGIGFFGNDLRNKNELWFTKSDMTTHIILFGATGAGKTEALVSLASNALVMGSGFVYVDGKGDNSLWERIFALARFFGREDDLLIINYMTGNRDVFGPQKIKLSNTMNPFSTGSSGGLTDMIVSLMDDSGGGGDMWKGRAMSLIGAIMMALVVLRDNKQILLDVNKIREYLILENIEGLVSLRDMPPIVIQSLKSYLRSIPGYLEGQAKQSEEVYNQHGYLQMQFTRIMGSLADAYGYIFRTNLGEVDFWDVVVNRRILVVLLPALEKSEAELSNLGKIIVACLKQMMASGLGTSLEGNRREMFDAKPTNSPSPFLCILDEYGYYAVKGAAVMAAQSRSLNFSMIYAGQDYPAFEKVSREEAASTLSNCNTKIIMKMEDPDRTYDIARKSAGEVMVATVSGQEKKEGSDSYSARRDMSFQSRERLHLLDLKEQLPGQAHIIFRSELVRAQMYYADLPKAAQFQVNHFLPIKAPDKNQMLGRKREIQRLQERIMRFHKTMRPDGMELRALRLLWDKPPADPPATMRQTLSLIYAACEDSDSVFDQEEDTEDVDQNGNKSVNAFSYEEEKAVDEFGPEDFNDSPHVDLDDAGNEDWRGDRPRTNRRRLTDDSVEPTRPRAGEGAAPVFLGGAGGATASTIADYMQQQREKLGLENPATPGAVDLDDLVPPSSDDLDALMANNSGPSLSPVFLDPARAKHAFAEIEQHGGMTEAEAEAEALSLMRQMSAVSQYPEHGGLEPKMADDLIGVAQELSEILDEIK